MEIKQTRHGEIAVVELVGSVDTRAAQELEALLSELLDKNTIRFAIGFSELEQITSSGLRVLVMLAKKLAAIDGGLVLFAMGPKVKTIFEISGLLDLFPMATSKKEALAQLASSKRMSKLSLLATKLLDGAKPTREAPGERRGRGAGGADSKLSTQVAHLLSRKGEPQPSTPAASENGRKKRRKPGSRRD